MTCRHKHDDPACSTYTSNVARAQKPVDTHNIREGKTNTPDAEAYDIVSVQRVGPHLVLKVLYPNCSKCSYEGNKILVFLNVSEIDVLRWRRIDPHFREVTQATAREAPGPSARFPASEEGWKDALAYATYKMTPGKRS